MRATTNDNGSIVIAKIHLERVQAKDSKTTAPASISDIASLNTHLPTICSCIFEQLGSQQLEAPYKKCLKLELEAAGVKQVRLEQPVFQLLYKGSVVGTRRADILLELESGEWAIIELKAVNEMQVDHQKQLEYYLHHSGVEKGYLVNFPHDSGFPAVDDQSSFVVSLLKGMMEKVEHLLTGGATLRLRNLPEKRQVEVLEVTRRAMNAEERERPRQRNSMHQNLVLASPVTGNHVKIVLKKEASAIFMSAKSLERGVDGLCNVCNQPIFCLTCLLSNFKA